MSWPHALVLLSFIDLCCSVGSTKHQGFFSESRQCCVHVTLLLALILLKKQPSACMCARVVCVYRMCLEIKTFPRLFQYSNNSWMPLKGIQWREEGPLSVFLSSISVLTSQHHSGVCVREGTGWRGRGAWYLASKKKKLKKRKGKFDVIVD